MLTVEIKIKRVYVTTGCITYLFRVAKTDKNTCLGYVLSVGGNTCLGSIL